MATTRQMRGGRAAWNDAYVGAPRQVTVDTENHSLRVHDGVTPGGRSTPVDGGAFKLPTRFDGGLAVGDDSNVSGLALGTGGAKMGRVPSVKTTDFFNPEGVASAGTGGWRWVSDEGVLASLSREGQLAVSGVGAAKRTYGSYEQATAAYVKANWKAGVLGGPRPAVLGLATPSDLAGYASRDSVGLYVENVGRAAGIVVANSTFTATRVLLGNTLNATLRARLRIGQVIDTVHTPQKYSGIVTGWDPAGAWIDVSGWFKVATGALPGSTAAGQVPGPGVSVEIDPQTITWALNVNTYVDADSQTGATVGIECGIFNNKSPFDYNALEAGDDRSNSYGFDAVAIGQYRAGWGYTARSVNARMWVGYEAFGMEYAGFVDSNNRLGVGNEARWGFLAQSGSGNAFGVMTRAQVPVFRVDGGTGMMQVGTIGPLQGHKRNGDPISGTRNGVQISGNAPGGDVVVESFGVDSNINLTLVAKGSGIVLLGRAANKLGFFGAGGILQQSVTGSRGGNVALASLIAALSGMNLIADNTSV